MVLGLWCKLRIRARATVVIRSPACHVLQRQQRLNVQGVGRFSFKGRPSLIVEGLIPANSALTSSLKR